MRILFLKDEKITNEKMLDVIVKLKEHYKRHTGINIKFSIENRDYTNVSGTIRHMFDSLPFGYLDKEVKAIHNKDNFAYDHIIFLVHENNMSWENKRLWGENFTNFWWSYNVSVCRWDYRSQVNTLGTLYHEMHHGHDAFIKTQIDVDVEALLGVNDWDSSITHGGEKPWTYIRSLNDNTSSLVYIADHLKAAYDKHKSLNLQKKVTQLQTVVLLLQKLVVLRRALLNKKKSVCKTSH